MARGAVWTPEQDALLRRKAAAGWYWPWSSLAPQLGRTPGAVRQRAIRIGLTDPRAAAEPLEPVELACRGCGGLVDAATQGRRSAVYCGDACRLAGRKVCPHCRQRRGTSHTCPKHLIPT